ncbi:MAG: NADH-quinone oxidoreductase subunit A [candidate division Zixibacteria bacterium]|nr:NADH-quinone oxidoreductase subunit A [candidate division Zixibacteria bacterium]MCI0595192.1 NADH-quinone oxidoreductase subunit A [candidate division Zixibacteria bacterium]
MFETYFPLAVMIAAATVIGVGQIALSHILGRKSKSPKKLIPYECGVDPVGGAHERFPVKYYLIAMLFIIFDIEVVFLFPWAVVYKQLAWFGFIEMAIFIFILFVGYVYIVKKGALQWE